ncbi:hypothetical protein [Xanthocytophaga agilis]|uniref:UbiA prenyltransferase family protein n=1 Tax=Xanthocytophaga agilis TaxID=3048010 RepID=A0AAE3UEF2_9BACT|nr:hypothetical protein [Xanthocytophaga agilis]MDJ1499488.1 hypothetical protein [Xanthocytophaga agilis]
MLAIQRSIGQNLIHFIFFGNYHYALYAVALSIEANMQLELPLNPLPYYVCIFLITLVYYTYAYQGNAICITSNLSNTDNIRSNWYVQHQQWVRFSQRLFSILGIGLGTYLVVCHWTNVLRLPLSSLGMAAGVVLLAALYYGWLPVFGHRLHIRQHGWIKPFIIGWVWAGLVTVAPVLFYQIEYNTFYPVNDIWVWLFCKNWLFISLTCIMFDIKDYASDANHQLKTFVVQYGLRTTLFYILIPLTVLVLASFLVVAYIRHFPGMRVILNLIPFLALLWTVYGLHQRRSILYYLIVIDGLLLIKAICGVVAALLGKM